MAENGDFAFFSPFIRLKLQYLVTFMAPHYKRTKYYNPLDMITNHANMPLERRIPNHDRNVAFNRSINGPSTVITILIGLQHTTEFR